MKEVISKYLMTRVSFWVCLAVSIALFVGGFFAPPMGAIDGSVLKAGGILLGFATLAVAGSAIAEGMDIQLKKDDLEVTISNDK